jgi:hypothetical protein
MKAQSSSALMTADLLLGAENVLRVNPELPSDLSGIDAVERLPELEALGRSEARRLMPELCARFMDARAEPFVASHGPEQAIAA